jgi:hypothetical protein
VSPGDLVVCVNNGPIELGGSVVHIAGWLEVGCVYAVRDRTAFKFLGRYHEGITVDNFNWLLLAERFRPVRPTSIECFRKIFRRVKTPHPSNLENVS